MVTPSLQSPDSGSGSISISNSATLPLPPPTAATTPNSMLSVRAMCNDVSKPCPDVDDEDMRAAAEALHGLRSSTHSLHPQGHSQGHSQPYSNEEWASTNFMARVQHLHLPLVASTVRAMANVAGMYESSKESSAIVRTSARAVEDKVKLVVGRLEPTVGSLAAGLDRFACSQLDKLERSFPSIAPQLPNGHLAGEDGNSQSAGPDHADSDHPMDMSQSPQVALKATHSLDQRLPDRNPHQNQHQHHSSHTQPDARHQYPVGTLGPPPPHFDHHPQLPHSQQPRDSKATRSTWHSVSSAVGTYVGGYVGSWVMNEEAHRGIKYCLQWLQYSTTHIDQQVHILRTHLTRFLSHPTPPLSPETPNSLVPVSDLSNILATVRREIAETLRTVVDVIGRYANQYLPGEARNRVRGFILGLPARFQGLSGGGHSEEANKVLNLAMESSNMLQSIMTILSQTVVASAPTASSGSSVSPSFSAPIGPPNPPVSEVSPIASELSNQQPDASTFSSSHNGLMAPRSTPNMNPNNSTWIGAAAGQVADLLPVSWRWSQAQQSRPQQQSASVSSSIHGHPSSNEIEDEGLRKRRREHAELMEDDDHERNSASGPMDTEDMDVDEHPDSSKGKSRVVGRRGRVKK